MALTQLLRRDGTLIHEAEGTLREVVLDAYMRRLDLYGANLSGAYLSGARMNWNSHDMIAEVLRRAADNDVARRSFAGLVLVSRDWCWKQFAALDIPQDLRAWVVATLRPFADASPPLAELKRLLQQASTTATA